MGPPALVSVRPEIFVVPKGVALNMRPSRTPGYCTVSAQTLSRWWYCRRRSRSSRSPWKLGEDVAGTRCWCRPRTCSRPGGDESSPLLRTWVCSTRGCSLRTAGLCRRVQVAETELRIVRPFVLDPGHTPASCAPPNVLDDGSGHAVAVNAASGDVSSRTVVSPVTRSRRTAALREAVEASKETVDHRAPHPGPRITVPGRLISLVLMSNVPSGM